MYRNKKLPVWAVVKRSYGYVWRHRGLLALPLGLLLAAQTVTGMIGLGVSMAAAATPPLIKLPLMMGMGLPVTAVIMAFSVGLHRAVLLDEVREGAAFLRWDRYWRNYVKASLIALLVGVLLAVVFTAALILPLGIGNALVLLMVNRLAVYGLLFLLFLGAVCLWLKIGLGFPAAAMGYRYVFSLSWRLTDGNLPRLFATLLLVHLPFMLPGLALLPSMRMGLSGLLWMAVNAVLGVVSLTLSTVANSLNFFFLFKASDEFGED